MTTIGTTVTPERIASVTLVETTASDAWRATVCLNGELDASVAADLSDELRRHLDAGRAAIRVDVSGVTFIDSTVLGALVAVHEQCRQSRSALIIAGASQPVRRMLALTGLDGVLLVDTAPDEVP